MTEQTPQETVADLKAKALTETLRNFYPKK